MRPALVFLWLAATAPAVLALDAPGQTSIPRIARLGRVQIGRSTQADLARRWGEGKEITGGHPNSGRLWQVKGTPWVLRTDGFESSDRGLVVDGLTLYEGSDAPLEAGLMAGVPVARPGKGAFAWCGGILPGMPEAKVLRILRRRSLPLTRTTDGWETKAAGHQALVSSIEPLRTWTARLVFTRGALSRLTLDASF